MMKTENNLYSCNCIDSIYQRDQVESKSHWLKILGIGLGLPLALNGIFIFILTVTA